MSTSSVSSSRSASSAVVPVADRFPDVVDLKSARDARQPQSAHWVCPACDLVADGFTPTECAFLAAVHDQVQHGSRQTAQIVQGSAPRPGADIDAAAPDLGTGLGIGA